MSRRKFIPLLLVFCLALFGFAAVSAAQPNTGAANEVLAAFDKEPLFTEADIKAFIKIAPTLVAAVNANDEAKAVAAMASAGWNEIRGAYVTSKIGNGYLMLTDPEDTQALFDLVQMPNSLIPVESEMALIKIYAADLSEIFK